MNLEKLKAELVEAERDLADQTYRQECLDKLGNAIGPLTRGEARKILDKKQERVDSLRKQIEAEKLELLALHQAEQ